MPLKLRAGTGLPAGLAEQTSSPTTASSAAAGHHQGDACGEHVAKLSGSEEASKSENAQSPRTAGDLFASTVVLKEVFSAAPVAHETLASATSFPDVLQIKVAASG